MADQTSLTAADADVTGGLSNNEALCFKNTLVSSSGLWLGSHPFDYALPLLMTQICIVVFMSHAIHYVFKHLGQPLIVSQIFTGIILGPTLISNNKTFATTMFPAQSKMYLDTVAGTSLVLFLFMIGVKTDLSMLKKSGKKAVAIGLVGSFLPFGLLIALGYGLKNYTPESFNENFFLFQLSSTWSRTSYVVLSCLLDELNLLNSKLGRLAMSATLFEEFTDTIMTTIGTAIQLGIHASTPMQGFGSFVSFVAFLCFIIFVARPLAMWMIRRTPEGELLDETYFLTIIMIAFGCGFAGEIIGHHATAGAFFLGLSLPGGPPLGSTLDEKLSGLIVWVNIPVFMAMAGYRTDLITLDDKKELFFLTLFILICAVGKMVGVLGACIYCKMPFRDALSLGLMLNTKGIFELYVLNNWMDGRIVDQHVYSVIVTCVMVFAAVTTPLVKTMYKPSQSYIAYKRRTIQHAKLDSELRILVCIHNEENVDPMIRILDASQFTKDAPVCIYVLHVMQLSGQTAAMLVPYKKHKGTESDHIVNAFKYLERRNKETMLVQPFVSVSQQATMHDDVCSLALDKKVSLVIIPFHKKLAIDGSLEYASHAFRSMNINVLDYAPCSVGILIDHGIKMGRTNFSTSFAEHIGVYFTGGPDDREALALAARMVGSSTIPLTVIRFVLPAEWRKCNMEQKMDDEVVNEFRLQNSQKQNVTYREMVVKDGEETMTVIRSMKDFGLLIIGRRHGVESPITSGLSMWSEYPELGLIGDMLASTDYGGKVSTLVVQQQTKVGSDQGGAVSCHNFGLGGKFRGNGVC